MDVEELLSRNQEHEKPQEGSPAWMVTFADMSILLLTFFILLLSFANMDAQKFKDMLGSVKDAFGTQTKEVAFYTTATEEERERAQRAEEELRSARDETGRELESPEDMAQALSIISATFADMGSAAEVVMDEEGIMVRVDGKVLFFSGSAELKSEALPVLGKVTSLLNKYTFDLLILGHTDSVPIETERFPSNWELSGARASATLRHLLDSRVPPQRLVAVGFADSRPIAANDTFQGRQKNRRVEFLFKNTEALPTGMRKPAQP